MKKLFIIVLLSSVISVYAMDQYDELREAIVRRDRPTIHRLLVTPKLELNTVLDGKNSALELALEDSDTETAECVAEEVSQLLNQCKESVKEAEVCLCAPFQKAAHEKKPEKIRRLMSLDIPDDLKTRGCGIALSSACAGDSYSPEIVELLINSYPEYIENPVRNQNFQRAAICFPKQHERMIRTVLRHPKAVEQLEDMLSSNGLTYSERRYLYMELLDQARSLQAEKDAIE